MNTETHTKLKNDIWDICNLLRGPYKRNEYRKVILPLTVLRRFDCLLAATKAETLEKYQAIKGKPDSVVLGTLQKVTGHPFYNLSKLDFNTLQNDPNNLAPNLNSYINAFSPNIRAIWINSPSISRSGKWRKRTCFLKSLRNSLKST